MARGMAPRSSKIGDIARRKVASQPGIEYKNSISETLRLNLEPNPKCRRDGDLGGFRIVGGDERRPGGSVPYRSLYADRQHRFVFWGCDGDGQVHGDPAEGDLQGALLLAGNFNPDPLSHLG